jgi:hypothetical protein
MTTDDNKRIKEMWFEMLTNDRAAHPLMERIFDAIGEDDDDATVLNALLAVFRSVVLNLGPHFSDPLVPQAIDALKQCAASFEQLRQIMLMTNEQVEALGNLADATSPWRLPE